MRFGNYMGRFDSLEQRIDFVIGQPVIQWHVRNPSPAAGEETDGGGETRNIKHREPAGT